MQGRTCRAATLCLGMLAVVSLVTHGLMREWRDSSLLRVVTWNIAAINNNPFEYWITHEDPDYNKLMANVQEFIDHPDVRDVSVSTVFTPEMFEELKSLMEARGWKGVKETEEFWKSDYINRKIISGFMRDASLGSKRLASMPDRVTNTINTVDEGVVNRPTVINCFAGDMTTTAKWWKEWKSFMFDRKLQLPSSGGGSRAAVPADMLVPIKKSKYPAITEAEEAASIPLQTLCQAIFDAILVHIVNTVSAHGKWQVLQQQMCDALNRHKDERTLSILADTYADGDVIFIQEAAGMFTRKAAATQLGLRYIILKSASLDGKRDQNSVLMLRRSLFDEALVKEYTNEVMKTFEGKKVPIANGDLLVMTAEDSMRHKYIFASFHGDTNGLATLPVFAAVDQFARTKPDHTLIFGLDANTHEHFQPGVTQGMLEFVEDFSSKGYLSCWGDHPDPTSHTTFNARTFLQAQLQKAAKENEKVSKGDKNPKDFIIFPQAAYKPLSVSKDNTGHRKYIEDMVFPTLEFPSDHGIVSSTLQRLEQPRPL